MSRPRQKCRRHDGRGDDCTREAILTDRMSGVQRRRRLSVRRLRRVDVRGLPALWVRLQEPRDCGCVYNSGEHATLRDAECYERGYYTHGGHRRLRRFRHRVRKARGLIRNALEYVHARTLLDVGCERIKEDVPIWKRETGPDGETWVGWGGGEDVKPPRQGQTGPSQNGRHSQAQPAHAQVARRQCESRCHQRAPVARRQTFVGI